MGKSDEVRRLLDERGVEHRDNDANRAVRYTRWNNGGKREVRYEEWRNGTTRLDAGNVSPEQAISATVGERVKDECFLMYDGKKYPATLNFGFLGLMPITIEVGGFRYLLEVPNEE